MVKDILLVITLLALLASPGFADRREASHPRSPHVTSTNLSTGVAPTPDRTEQLILANDVKPDGRAGRSDATTHPPASPTNPPDPRSNRDFERPQRASPEAADDLFQLIKRAGPKHASKPK